MQTNEGTFSVSVSSFSMQMSKVISIAKLVWRRPSLTCRNLGLRSLFLVSLPRRNILKMGDKMIWWRGTYSVRGSWNPGMKGGRLEFGCHASLPTPLTVCWLNFTFAFARKSMFWDIQVRWFIWNSWMFIGTICKFTVIKAVYRKVV